MSLAFLLAAAVQAQQPAYDLLLKRGHLIDPKNNIDAPMDIAIGSGKVAAVAADIDPARAAKVIDLGGLYVTPGIVDIHTHLYATSGMPDAWAGDNSVLPDGFSFRSGVTTMVDAGSAGWRNFEMFRHTVIDRAQTRVFAMINIAGLGMMTDAAEQEESDFRPEEVAKIAARNKDIVVGVKSAHYRHPDWTSVDRAIEAGRLSGLPVMVDFGYFLPQRPYWQLVTEKLRPGDITTHVYRGSVPWIDEHGKLHAYLSRARARGVKFDVGHGGGSFVFRNAVPAVRLGFYPDSISSDLHTLSMNAAMMDMPTTMSKFLAMGMSLPEVILRSTWNPAQIVHHSELGHLTVGAAADIAVWSIQRGDFGFADTGGGQFRGRERLFCEMTLKDGRIAWDWNARSATDYRKLSPDYGIRRGIDAIVVPK
ncbi:MAG TPA: amidohydrolase/deacetylase family metallohydrolase [Bryobacterales bacterium]|jgi:dihydroorotase|nr:amidohydrolase/deacetylase family metallohydrolase [Bryobacterales bacterium]